MKGRSDEIHSVQVAIDERCAVEVGSRQNGLIELVLWNVAPPKFAREKSPSSMWAFSNTESRMLRPSAKAAEIETPDRFIPLKSIRFLPLTCRPPAQDSHTSAVWRNALAPGVAPAKCSKSLHLASGFRKDRPES
jgi:hypothetical protein